MISIEQLIVLGYDVSDTRLHENSCVIRAIDAEINAELIFKKISKCVSTQYSYSNLKKNIVFVN